MVGPVIVHEAQDRHYWTVGRTLKALPLPKAGFARRGMGMCKSSKCAPAEQEAGVSGRVQAYGGDQRLLR